MTKSVFATQAPGLWINMEKIKIFRSPHTTHESDIVSEVGFREVGSYMFQSIGMRMEVPIRSRG